jgi:histidinol-phosphate aminotransferase
VSGGPVSGGPVSGGLVSGLAALPLRPDLRSREPYGAPQLNLPIRLNTNENPYPPPPELVRDLVEAVTRAATSLNRYPDREAVELREALAGYLGHDLAPAQLWAANGSNEIIQQLLLAFGGAGRAALGFEPAYTMHRLIARATGTGWHAVARGPGFDLDPAAARAAVAEHRPEVLFICSPNNPTGTAADLEQVAELYDASSGMVVVDEAYAEFSSRPSALTLLPGRPRLVVIRTMSKAFAFAGARVGYLAADPAVVDAMRIVRLPYHLSAVTQAAALAALRHADATLAGVAVLREERDRMAAELRALGYRVVDSDANFLLVGGWTDEKVAWAQLRDRGILVRDVGLSGWLRVTVGRSDEVSAFLAAAGEMGRASG